MNNPTEKQKTIAEQAVYDDMRFINPSGNIRKLDVVSSIVALRDKSGLFKPILRPLDLTKEITHKGYNDNEPFIPLVELAKIASSEYKDAEIVDFNELTKTVEFYCNDARDSEVELRKFFYVNSGAFIVEDSRGCDFDVIDHNTYMKLIDLLHQWHFDTRNLISQGGVVDANTLPKNPYEV